MDSAGVWSQNGGIGSFDPSLREQVQSAIASRLANQRIAAADRLAKSTDALDHRILRATQSSRFGSIGVVIAIIALARGWGSP